MKLSEKSIRRLWRFFGVVTLGGAVLPFFGFPVLVGLGVVSLGFTGTFVIKRVAVSVGVTLVAADSGDGGGGDGGGGGK